MIELFSIFKWFTALIDPVLAVWVAVIMVAGFWLKRSVKLPSWLPPLPVCLFVIFLVVSLLFGWVTNAYEGARGVFYVVAYALGNSIAFTGLSFVIYDIAHGVIKKKGLAKTGETEEAVKTEKKGISEEARKKIIVYGVAALAAFCISGLVSYIVFFETILYSFFFGLFGAGVAAVIARTVYHLAVLKDNTPRMWGVSVDFLISCGGWLFAVLSTSILGSSVGLAATALGLIMAYGNRFVGAVKEIAGAAEDTAKTEGQPTVDYSQLKADLLKTMKYAFINDNPDLGEDKSRALCMINGVAYTPVEAYAMGKGAAAAEAQQYVNMIVEKIQEEQ